MKRKAAIRVPGWFMNRLKNFTRVDVPNSNDVSTKTTSYKKVPGLNKQVFNLLFKLTCPSKHAQIHRILIKKAIFKKFNNFFIDPVLPKNYNIFWLNNAYLIKLLFTRSYRAERMLLKKPAHGQRRWSNANTAKYLNIYLERVMRDCELELFNFKKRVKRQFTKLDEMRMRSKNRSKKKTKKFTKFKKFGEKRVAAKKRKKTPWQ